ncbi:MAG: bifunctional precorrin-2 dehydrogenase/sirohydrochlorin ferrochelatase [Candidatus Latescibacterota bacterium]
MRLQPIMVSLQGKKVVVIGGGPVAERKIRMALDCGAFVSVISPELTEGLTDLALDHKFIHLKREYRNGDLAGANFAFAAIDDPDVSREIAADADKRNILLNVVDQPDHCSFIVPAVVRRGRLTLAVSTGGASPALARNIKNRLAGEFGDEYIRLLDALAEIREFCMQKIPDPIRRREILLQMADDTLLELARSHNRLALEKELLRRITNEME